MHLLGSACSPLFWLFCSIPLDILPWSGQPTIRRAWPAQVGWKVSEDIRSMCAKLWKNAILSYYAKTFAQSLQFDTFLPLVHNLSQPAMPKTSKNSNAFDTLQSQSTHVSIWSGFRLACKHVMHVVGWLRLQSYKYVAGVAKLLNGGTWFARIAFEPSHPVSIIVNLHSNSNARNADQAG